MSGCFRRRGRASVAEGPPCAAPPISNVDIRPRESLFMPASVDIAAPCLAVSNRPGCGRGQNRRRMPPPTQWRCDGRRIQEGGRRFDSRLQSLPCHERHGRQPLTSSRLAAARAPTASKALGRPAPPVLAMQRRSAAQLNGEAMDSSVSSRSAIRSQHANGSRSGERGRD